MHKIFLMGPQGSGKGTQAQLLAKHLSIPALSMGQLLRDELASGSELSERLRAIMMAGELVSDKDAAQILQTRLAQPDTTNGYILDGYPRNKSQYHAFDFDMPTRVVVIDVTRDESLKRLGGRLSCRGCDKVASLVDGVRVGDVCACGAQWYQREDDTPSAISRRLDIYEQDTEPVIARYGDLVRRVNGDGTREDVFARILEALN